MQTRRRGQTFWLVIGAVALVGLIAGGIFLFGGNKAASTTRGQDVFAVRRGGFEITVPATGELAALRQIEVKNDLEQRAVITEIVKEGTRVTKGDVLFRLNDEELRDQIRTAEDAADNAQNELDVAEASLSIAKNTRESELSKADVAVALAQLALDAWRDGTDVSKKKELELALETAEKNFARLDERFKTSQTLLEQEFISLDEYKQDEIALIEARARLEQANLDIEVYNKYTRKEELETKRSNLEQAQGERQRVEQRMDAEVQSAESDVRSRKRQLDSNLEQLRKLQRQLDHTAVTAASDGLVVYASSLEMDGWRGGDDPPAVGTELHRNQTVMVLPDTSRMIASVKVNEALSGQIEAGQPATIVSDAMPNRRFDGEVIGVGVLAEQGGWRDPNRRDYTVRIMLDDENTFGLKPSMRCKANIRVGEVNDALYVPIQSVFRKGRTTFVYTPTDDGNVAATPITLGRASELYVEVRDGLQEGQLVLLRQPKPGEVLESEGQEEEEREEPRERVARGERPTEATAEVPQ